MPKLTRISISLEEDLQQQFDELSAEEGFPTRSEAFKALIRQRLTQKEWTKGGVVAGAISIVYDHHARDLVTKLMDVQHDFFKVIVSSQHVHLDHHSCLEIVIVRGNAKEILKLVTALKAIKGLKHSGLVMATAGE